jgi:hypothetical protein
MQQTNEITVSVSGANRVELVEKLRAFADNLDGAPAETNGKVVTTKKPTTTKSATAPVDEEVDDDFKSEGPADGGFEDDGGFEEEQQPPAKTAKPAAAAKTGKAAKPKKITLDDVNDACKAHAQANGRPATLDVLQKNFKTQSVTALKAEQYEKCIALMGGN